MRSSLICAALLACCAALTAQAPAPTGPMAEMGFNYQLPPEWTVVQTKPQHRAAAQAPAATEPRKGNACIQVALTAQRLDSSSVIVVVDVPFDCFGETMTAQDLPGLGSGAAEGLKQAFDVLEPVYGAYSLGSHQLWIERAKGSLKGHAETSYTLEIVCSLLNKGAACWMTMAADADSLRAFETAPVTLDGDPATPLVPSTAFGKGPS
ncbi:MAG: hypothetical protein WBE72_16210 [Terracidiphilus sp.]